MKRSFQSDKFDKKRRVELSILKLPTDILIICFQQLSPIDIINLSCVDKQHRHELTRFIFNRIKCTWHSLMSLEHSSDIAKVYPFASQLRVLDCYSYGEWQIDPFPRLHYFPNLSHLLINSSSSSNWLKYRQNNQITKLTLYYEAGHSESEAMVDANLNSKNPKRINHLVSTNAKIFSLLHLCDFSNLTEVTLYDYHFNWEIDDTSQLHAILLKALALIDCTWEYPFELGQFNVNSSILTLSIRYTSNHAFILLERFTKFLENPMDSNSESIQALSIIFQSKYDTWLKVLSTTQLSILLGEKFPKLLYLRLSGWLLNLNTFNSYMELLNDNNLKMLDLSITDTSSRTTSNQLIHTIVQQADRQFPWMAFHLRVLPRCRLQEESFL